MANVRNVLDDTATSPTQFSKPLQPSYVSTGEAQADTANAAFLGQVTKSLNDFTDEQTILAGTNDGLKAGMKPDFQPLEGTSLYDKAFNKMGVSSYVSQIQVSAAQNAQRIYNANKADPVALQAALDTYKNSFSSNLFPEAKLGFENTFDQHALTYVERAQQQHEKDTIDLTTANNSEAFQAILNGASNSAFSVRNDRQFAAIAIQQRDALMAKMFEGAPREGGNFEGHEVPADPTRLPTYTWQDMQKSLKTFDDTLLEQRALGKMDRAPDKEAFRKQFMSDVKSSSSTEFSPEVLDKIDTKMRSVISHENAEIDRQKNANALDLQYAMDNAERAGDASELPTPDDIQDMVGKNRLSPSMGRTLTNRLIKVTDSANEYQGALKNVDVALSGGIALDGKDPVQVQAIDTRYRAFAGSLAAQDPSYQSEMKSRFAGQIGVIPSDMNTEIRTGLRSNDPAKVVSSVDLLNRMKVTNPRLLDSVQENDKHYYESISASIEQGIDPTDAINKARTLMNVPSAQRDARGDEYDNYAKANPSSSGSKWIASQTDRWFSRDPAVDAQMAVEFDQQAKANYIQNGNMEASQKMALDSIQKVWARSEVGGNQRWIKFAPERLYGVPTMSDSENSKWMNEQLMSDIKSNALNAKDLTSDRVIVTPNPAAQLPDGRPTYLISVIGKDGLLYAQKDGKGNNLSWVPDWSTSPAYKKMQSKTQSEIDKAQAKRNSYIGGQ